MFLDWGYEPGPDFWKTVKRRIEIREDDEDRRVRKLRRPKGITTLSPLVGRLDGLEELDLSRTTSLKRLPEEIGDVRSLKKLNLAHSAIELLPSSTGKLLALQELRLRYNNCLKTLSFDDFVYSQ